MKCFYRGKLGFCARRFFLRVCGRAVCVCVMEGSEKFQTNVVLPFSAADVYQRAGMDTEYVRVPINRTASLSFSVKTHFFKLNACCLGFAARRSPVAISMPVFTVILN